MARARTLDALSCRVVSLCTREREYLNVHPLIHTNDLAPCRSYLLFPSLKNILAVHSS
jgi:hypothetical protein